MIISLVKCIGVYASSGHKCSWKQMQLEMLKLTKSSSFKLIRHNSQGIKDKQKRRALSASKSEIQKENLLSF